MPTSLTSPGPDTARRVRRLRLPPLLSVLLIIAHLLAACGSRPAGAAGGLDALGAPTLADAADAMDSQAASALMQVAATTVDPRKLAAAPSAQVAVVATMAPDDGRPLDHTTNILVLGSDRRPDTPNWRTDVMMIVALDEAGGRAGVISIPRDIYIDVIPGHQANKINVIDYLGEKDTPGGGGPALMASIIEEKMGIHIDHWVRFDFAGFVKLVDALGGVEVDIDCAYYDYFQIEDVVLNVKPGVQRLSGDEALVYVRSRTHGGDLDRARRQQRFIWAIRNQVLNESILTKLPALYNAVSDSVQTDMGVVSALKVVRFAIGLDREEITGEVIGYPLVQQGYAGNMWIFKADWDAIRTEVQSVFDREPFIDTNTLVKCP